MIVSVHFDYFYKFVSLFLRYFALYFQKKKKKKKIKKKKERKGKILKKFVFKTLNLINLKKIKFILILYFKMTL